VRRTRRGLPWVCLALCLGVFALAGLAATGLVIERTARTPLVRVGQQAPGFTLPSTGGGERSLAAERGRPVLLVFVPAMRCATCIAQLRAVQESLPTLRRRGVVVLAVSVDTDAFQRDTVTTLRLDYPLLSEAPTYGQHPASSAYGVYHFDTPNAAPVSTYAVVAIDAAGIVRAVTVRPEGVISSDEIVVAASVA